MRRLSETGIGAGMLQWRLTSGSGAALSFGDVLRDWAASESFRRQWLDWLRALQLDACVWECPPVRTASLSRPFECVFLASPSLAGMRPEPEVFAQHFRPDRSVVTFANLGGDAVLVAPCPAGDGRDFSHLARFVRTAAPEQQDALWKSVGEAMTARVGTVPVWLSTAGHGVAWLHVRLDSTPKYYRHDAYRRGLHDGR
jgi:hypothetical protein